MEHILISGFADEISPDFDEQLRVVTSLGMEYISLRTADGKGIADYTAEEVEEKLLPRLREANLKVSSLGSPIGKINVDDQEAFEKQLLQMENSAKSVKCLIVDIFACLASLFQKERMPMITKRLLLKN